MSEKRFKLLQGNEAVVEGAIAAAVAAACGLSLDKVKEAAEQARSVNKIN